MGLLEGKETEYRLKGKRPALNGALLLSLFILIIAVTIHKKEQEKIFSSLFDDLEEIYRYLILQTHKREPNTYHQTRCVL